MKNSLLKRKLISNLKYVMMIFLCSVLVMIPFFHSGVLHSGVDMSFHLNRIYELAENLKRGSIFPYISTYSFNQVGTPINMFYGALPLYIAALLFIIVNNPITAIYLFIWVFILLDLLISFWVGKKYWNGNAKIALLFSFIYVFSSYTFNWIFRVFDLGQTMSFAFLPIIAYGTYEIFFKDYKKWYLLPLGMACVIYTHLISTIIYSSLVAGIALLGVIISDKKIKRLKYFMLAVISSIGLTMFFWANLCQAFSKNALTITKASSISSARLRLGDLLTGVLNNNSSTPLGVVIVFGTVLGLCYWKKLNKSTKIIGITGLFLCLAITNEFNFIWYFLNKTPLSFLQWPGRSLCIITFLLSIFSAEAFFKLLNQSNMKYAVILAATLFFFFSNTYTFLNDGMAQQNVEFKPSYKKPFPFSNYQITSKKVFYYLVSNYYSGVGSADYWPSQSLKYAENIRKHQALINNKSFTVAPISGPNYIKYCIWSKKAHSTVDLPFLYYFNYVGFVNGKRTAIHRSNRSTALIKLNKGKNLIKIEYIPSTKIKVSAFVSLLTLLVMIVLVLYNQKDTKQREMTEKIK